MMDERAPPDGLVDLRSRPGLRFVIGYHREDNFTGARLPGYGAPGAWLERTAAARLDEVLARLAPEGLGLVVYDAYRPARATAAMVAWCEASGREELLEGWVGRHSRHNLGSAIDVGLVHLASGGGLPMGTAWDAFEAASAHHAATGASRVHRRLLREVMTGAGFSPYDREWWHFEAPRPADARPLDTPYGVHEPNAAGSKEK